MDFIHKHIKPEHESSHQHRLRKQIDDRNGRVKVMVRLLLRFMSLYLLHNQMYSLVNKYMRGHRT